MRLAKNKKGVDRNDGLFIVLTFFVLAGTFLIASIDSPTGFAVSTFEHTKKVVINEYYVDDRVINMNLDDLKKISITGKYTAKQGDEARIYVETDKGVRLLLAEILIEETSTSSISPFTARVTDQAQEETITDDEEEDDEVVEEDDEVVEEDDEVVEEDDEVVEEDDGVVEEDDGVVEEEELFVKDFERLCGQTCDLMKTSITKIIIEVNGGELFLKELNYVQETQGIEEEILKEVEDIQLEIGETKTINVAEYFEGEGLVYDAKSSEGYSFTVSDNEITFEGLKQGTWGSLLYALDGDALIISNNFNIIISGDEYVPDDDVDEEVEEPSEPDDAEEEVEEPDDAEEEVEEPSEPDDAEEEEEETVETPEEEKIVGCDHPDPNQRPLECIQHDNTTYFQEEALYVENKRAETVAKFTPIGNLLITGDIVERTNQEPNDYDYQFGYTDNNGFFVPTIWINSNTGDLHLKGQLTEANSNIVLEIGLNGISNKRGILLAMVNRQIGDMTLRGNAVPYRRSLE